MRVYFLRHGAAEDAEAVGGDDSLRHLTEDGAAIVVEVADRLAALGVTADAVLTSPLTRAAQTAQIVAEKLDLVGVLEEDPRLESGSFDIDALREILMERSSAEAIMLVGHEPDFSETIEALVGGGAVKLKKAGMARVDVPDVHHAFGVLVWLAPPALLRR